MVAVHNDPNSNEVLASLLSEIAQLLRRDGASAYRVAAYERAAETLSELEVAVEDIYRCDGVAGLIEIPTVGRSIAGLIEHYLQSTRIPLLERLRGEDVAARTIASLPTLGSELARRIHEQLHIDTLPQLLAAANDGTLRQVHGVGEKRIRAIRDSLAHRRPQQNSASRFVQLPLWDETSLEKIPVAELLDLDAEFRRMTANESPPNEKLSSRLLQRGERHYRAHYSDSPRAHQLQATRDWVVLERSDRSDDAQWTVVTSYSGKLHGCRVVRGREEDCYRYYRQAAKQAVEAYPMTWT